MAKLHRICPFSHRSCKECNFYLGRHCYTDFQSVAHRIKHNNKKRINYNEIPLLRFGNSRPDMRLPENERNEDLLSRVKLKIIDLISEQSKVYPCEAASTWTWDDPDVQRFINGCMHVTSWEQLKEYCLRKARSGETEVVIYESPSYLMVAGG